MSPTKRRPPDTISRAEMRDALRRSGYLIEQRVEALLLERGYYVQTNAAYPDEVTGKSRELDIWAMLREQAGPALPDSLFLVLLCECQNNPQPVVFFTKEAQVPFLYHEELKMSGLPIKIWNSQEARFERLSHFLGLQNYHHYCEEWVSTQYCTFDVKGRGQARGEWFAFHREEQHEEFAALRMAVEGSVEEHYKGWEIGESEPVNIQVYYPVLVLGGPLLEAYVEDSRLLLRKLGQVCFRMEYHSAQYHGVYQVDVVQEKHVPKYLDTIEQEIKRMARLMRRRKDRVRESIDRIVSGAGAAEGKSARQLFEQIE